MSGEGGKDCENSDDIDESIACFGLDEMSGEGVKDCENGDDIDEHSLFQIRRNVR